MAKYQILYWHDIPVQVRARERGRRVTVPLSPRFQEAIDNAAMRAKKYSGDDYTDGYDWGEMQERPGSPQEVAEAVATELEAQYPAIDWRKTAEKLKAEG